MLNPIYIQKYNIYDIFHNDNNNIIIISPMEQSQLVINYKNINFDVNICSHNHTYIYVLQKQIDYINQIELTINSEIIETKVNKYQEFKDKIIFSTIVLNEDNYIVQWINYHYKIGISHFIIYDNSDNNTLESTLNKFIENNIVILIKWKYPYLLQKSGISGQTTQQNHSIWAFKNSKYIGLFDIDEYINLKMENNIDILLQKIIDYNNININDIGSFRLLNKFFYNPHNLSTTNYDFLNIYNCDQITLQGHEKNFVIPKNVLVFSVHMIIKGNKMLTIPHNILFFNHYYFLNKSNRGINKTDLIDDSIKYNVSSLLKDSI
jgi:hypothetical protein